MFDVVRAPDLRMLAEVHEPHCLSVYLPTHTVGETIQDAVRLKNLLARAARELGTAGLSAVEVEALLAPATVLLADENFWAHQGRGLALFIAGGDIRTYRLPDPVAELVVVADRLHVKPLLPSVTSGEFFYVLALSQNRVRLLRGSRYAVNELALDEIPDSLAHALRFDDREPQLQSHAATRTGTGQVAPAFHGQGAGKDARDADADRFVAVVDAGVCQHLADSTAPLVLAGVTDLVARYRRLSKYAHIVDEAIAGNPELTSAAEFHDRAWPIISPLFDTARRAAHERVLSREVPTSTSVDEVVTAAHDGRVRSLFVQLGAHCWGRFDDERRDVEQHDARQPGDRDLLDVATLDTLLAGGRVFAVERQDLPVDEPLVAEFRY
ncbi:MAG: hypothetical protein HKN44_02160 [Ilumatobacter sp.]|nr:hypothetical protein [Ilumatobacter sp.]